MPSESMSMTASKSLRGEIAIRIGAADQGVQIVFAPVLAGGGGDDLLRQNIERVLGDLDALQIAVADGANERGAFDQFIARGGEEAALRLGADPVPERPMRCSATAIERGEPIWQARSTVPISMPSSSEAVATTARSSPALQPRFGVEPQLRDRLP